MGKYSYGPQYTALHLNRESYAQYSNGDWGFRPDGSEDFSLTLWFWPDNPNGRLIDGDGALTLDLMDNQLIFWLKGYSDLICTADHYPIVRHEWNHVAITYCHLGQITFYVNGILTGVYSVFQGEPANKWGGIRFCPGIEGYLRSVQFFSKQLSDAEVDQVKRNISGAPAPVRWFDFEAAAPKEKNTGILLELEDGAQPYALGDGLFCDNGEGFYPLDGDVVNPAANQDATYTVQAWISIYDREQTFAILFMNGRHALDCGMVLYLEKAEDGYHLCAGRGAHTRDENILRSTHVIPTRSWHNVAVTYDGTAMCIYIDGVLEGKSSSLTPFTGIMDHGLLRIGTDDLPGLSDSDGCFHGAFGNIAIWNRALTPEELERYAAAWPQYGDSGLVADYVFTRYSCYNAVNGFEVSTAGVDTSKICRNPITQDLPRPEAPAVPPPAAMLQTLRGKTAAELHRERSSALPDVEFVLRTALAELGTERLYTALRPEITTQLEQLRTGETLHPFYHCELDDMGRYHFYYVSDQIYPAGVLSLRGRSEFAAWLIRMLSTLAIDVFSIYCVLPASVSSRIPQAFTSSILNDRAGQLFNSLKDSGLKSLVSSLCKFLLGGGLLAQVIAQLQSQGIWTVGANLLTMVSSFLVKAGTVWGWITVIVRVAFLVIDMVSLYQEMPKLLGAELLQLRFEMGGVFVPASCCPDSKPTPQWQEGLDSQLTSPVVCCLRQARAAKILVTAQFSVYTSGKYQISATAKDNFPLGAIEAKDVKLQAGKDGTCTIQLAFTGGTLEKTGIDDVTTVLKWTIKGGNATITQETALRVFFIYDIPQRPWGNKSGYGTPWTKALACACANAKGAVGDTDALWSEAIVRAMIQGMWTRLSYQETAVYTYGSDFHLTRFLTDMESGAVAVNENDCGALLVALCNLLGCGLYSVLLCGQTGKPLNTRRIIPIGSTAEGKYSLQEHEAVVELRGLVPYYSNLCYQMPGEGGTMQHPVMRPFHTEAGGAMGYCEMFLDDPAQCILSGEQRTIGNGQRTIS